MWICKNTYYQAILCEHAPHDSLLFAFISVFRAVNSPVTGFPLPLSDTPQHWLQPLISNQAWACVSCSSIYSRPANRHKSTSKISLRTISFKRSFRRFSETTREEDPYRCSRIHQFETELHQESVSETKLSKVRWCPEGEEEEEEEGMI